MNDLNCWQAIVDKHTIGSAFPTVTWFRFFSSFNPRVTSTAVRISFQWGPEWAEMGSKRGRRFVLCSGEGGEIKNTYNRKLEQVGFWWAVCGLLRVGRRNVWRPSLVVGGREEEDGGKTAKRLLWQCWEGSIWCSGHSLGRSHLLPAPPPPSQSRYFFVKFAPHPRELEKSFLNVLSWNEIDITRLLLSSSFRVKKKPWKICARRPPKLSAISTNGRISKIAGWENRNRVGPHLSSTFQPVLNSPHTCLLWNTLLELDLFKLISLACFWFYF